MDTAISRAMGANLLRYSKLLDETGNRSQCGTKRNSASGRSIEHVALNHTHDTPRCYVTPSTIQRIVRVAGAAHVGNLYCGKADDRYHTAGVAGIAPIHRHERIPLTIGIHLVLQQILKRSPGRLA